MRPVLWKSILLSLCVAAVPATAHTQTMAKTLDELRLLVKPGQTIAVTDDGGRVSSGTISTLTPSALVLDVNGKPREWKEGDISTISQRRADSLGNGALWGLVIGGGFATTAALLTIAQDEADFDEREAGWAALAIGLYAAMGTGVGVGIDALIKKEQVIYQKAGTTSARWQLAPFVAPRAQGARLSLRF